MNVRLQNQFWFRLLRLQMKIDNVLIVKLGWAVEWPRWTANIITNDAFLKNILFQMMFKEVFFILKNRHNILFEQKILLLIFLQFLFVWNVLFCWNVRFFLQFLFVWNVLFCWNVRLRLLLLFSPSARACTQCLVDRRRVVTATLLTRIAASLAAGKAVASSLRTFTRRRVNIAATATGGATEFRSSGKRLTTVAAVATHRRAFKTR